MIPVVPTVPVKLISLLNKNNVGFTFLNIGVTFKNNQPPLLIWEIDQFVDLRNSSHLKLENLVDKLMLKLCF